MMLNCYKAATSSSPQVSIKCVDLLEISIILKKKLTHDYHHHHHHYVLLVIMRGFYLFPNLSM